MAQAFVLTLWMERLVVSESTLNFYLLRGFHTLFQNSEKSQVTRPIAQLFPDGLNKEHVCVVRTVSRRLDFPPKPVMRHSGAAHRVARHVLHCTVFHSGVHAQCIGLPYFYTSASNEEE
jgi:hypothetical protein